MSNRISNFDLIILFFTDMCFLLTLYVISLWTRHLLVFSTKQEAAEKAAAKEAAAKKEEELKAKAEVCDQNMRD